MKTRRRVGRAALTAALGLSLLGVGAPAASADTNSGALPISSYKDIVVDGVHQHVFLSDPVGGSVLVTDYQGQVVQRIDGAAGAWGLALSADSGTLYVALRDAGAIAAVDTATLRETARFDTGTGAGVYAGPTSLATAGGQLWFGYAKDTWTGALGSVDLSDTEPKVTLDHVMDDFGGFPHLVASPADPDLLVAAEADGNSVAVALYDVGSGQAERREQKVGPGPQGCSSLQDLSLTPDARQVVVSCAEPDMHQVFSTTDLSHQGQYAVDGNPVAVAVAPDGTIATGTHAGGGQPDVSLFTPGEEAAFKNWDLPATSDELYAPEDTLRSAGLAWAPDGGRLFAVTEIGASHPTSVGLRVLDMPQVATSLTLTAPATSPRNHDLTLTGRVVSPVPLAADSTVDVIRLDDPALGEGTHIGTAPVAADGTFSFVDLPRAKGSVQYTAHYYGDARHAYSYGSVTVDIVSD
ncbi:YncE family protein [Streptomyces sp. rh34]|uniref:YncE family protein n=1 Tax=Streptomyces sp. rh34 TaxID=2034272 RepID=UPI000BF2001D|nr:hypothetical protein [Streptomyces sp. rh34]